MSASEDVLILTSSTVLMVGFLLWPRVLSGLSCFKCNVVSMGVETQI